MSFSALGLPAPILRGVRAAGYQTPTPIQQRAIPVILAGKDLIGAAQTGSGKTAAFVLPILARLIDGPRRTRALILTPTRELAAQVETNARDYARYTRLRVTVAYGGVAIGPQIRELAPPAPEVLVATPGRLLDLHERAAVRLDDVEILVLDEADRMVDMGFAPDLRRILRLLPDDRQTLLFSATMPAELNRIANDAIREPERIDLAPPSKPAAGITQAVYPVARHRKTALLDRLLRDSAVGTVIVFARTKHGADRLARQLDRLGHSCTALHGNRTQSQRERALNDLRRGRVQVLVATDIASRGIDVDDITHVINYDVPHSPEDYVHRIGRTGRRDLAGDAFTLMSPEEGGAFRDIEKFLGRTIPRVTLPDFAYDLAREAHSVEERDALPGAGRGRGPRGRGRSSGPPAPTRGTSARGAAGGRERRATPPASAPPRAASPGAASATPSHGRRPVRGAPSRRGGRRL